MAAVHVRQGHNEQGAGELRRASAILRELGDRSGAAAAENRLGIALMQLGRLGEALERHRHAYDIYRDLGERLPAGRAANNLGVLCVRLGRYDEAATALAESLAVAESTGNRAGVGVALANLGDLAARQHRCDDAAARFREAIAVCEPIGYLGGLADARRGLGVALAHLGAVEAGLASLRDALRLGRRIGDADIETSTLNDLGLVECMAGPHGPDGTDGSASFRAAHACAARTGDRYQQARALDGQARCAFAAGRVEEADRFRGAAQELFLALGTPEAAVPAPDR
jgi:tetratricopeptide (TPR) repeat protein